MYEAQLNHFQNMNLSVGQPKSAALQQNSQLHGFLLNWLDFASKNLQDSCKS